MRVETTRFGPMEVDEEKVIIFSRGIPGFENLRRFFILPAGNTEDIQWLQAMDDPAVALLIIDPFKYFRGYSVDIPESDLQELQIKESNQALVAAVVTLPGDDPANATANLLAPIIINTGLNRAKQIILSDAAYVTRHRLFTEKQEDEKKTETQPGGGEE